MKIKLLTICLLLFTSQVFSNEDVTVLKKEVLKGSNGDVMVAFRILCIGNHKFLNTSRYERKATAKGVTMAVANSSIQIFEERDGKSLPAKCK